MQYQLCDFRPLSRQYVCKIILLYSKRVTVVADSVLIEENSAIDVQALHPQERERKTGNREISDRRAQADPRGDSR